jgi:hypothetical protein
MKHLAALVFGLIVFSAIVLPQFRGAHEQTAKLVEILAVAR